jgi:hypothetical protein
MKSAQSSWSTICRVFLKRVSLIAHGTCGQAATSLSLLAETTACGNQRLQQHQHSTSMVVDVVGLFSNFASVRIFSFALIQVEKYLAPP